MRIEQLPWDDLRYLLAVHRHGSFLGAAQSLGLSTSTISRRIDALERTLGHAVVQRTTKGARLEDEALALVATAEQFETTLRALARDPSDARSAHAGTVRVSVPDGFGPAMAVAAARVQRVHPETHVEVVVESRYADLAGREADLAVRNGRSSSRVLTERALGEIRVGLYASPDYLARHVPSRRLEADAITSLDFIGVDATPHGADGSLASRGARRHPFSATSVDARVQAAREGLGIVALGVGVGYAGLERLVVDPPLPSLRFFLTMRHELRKVPRVRVVAAAIVEIFDEHLAAQDAEDTAFARASRLRRASSRSPRTRARP
ncbi:MAG: LysR family transcriptional regulator [Deltaproteobacteria bacterium]|nr:LysR family transcriptional regulator [Deltaproteobacteria bacterium]